MSTAEDGDVKRNATRVLMKCLDRYDPVALLETLHAQIGYNAGYVIRLNDRMRERILKTIQFHKNHPGKGDVHLENFIE